MKYYMRYVEGIPRSEQILWFIDNYVKKGYKTADREHVLRNKYDIDNDSHRKDIGVECGYNMYYYLYDNNEPDEKDIEVFYPANEITLGELL